MSVGCGCTRTPRHICGDHDIWRTKCMMNARDHLDAPCIRAFAERQHQPRMNADYTRTSRLEHVRQADTTLCGTFYPHTRRAASCEALLEPLPPARKSSGFGPLPSPCVRHSAHGWLTRRAQPHPGVLDGARAQRALDSGSRNKCNAPERPPETYFYLVPRGRLIGVRCNDATVTETDWSRSMSMGSRHRFPSRYYGYSAPSGRAPTQNSDTELRH